MNLHRENRAAHQNTGTSLKRRSSRCFHRRLSERSDPLFRGRMDRSVREKAKAPLPIPPRARV